MHLQTESLRLLLLARRTALMRSPSLRDVQSKSTSVKVACCVGRASSQSSGTYVAWQKCVKREGELSEMAA